MQRAGAFFALTRAKFLPLSVVPIIITASIVQLNGDLLFGRLVWVLLGVVLLHAAGNVVNDCYDFCLGADKKNTAGRYSGGSGIMPSGLVEVWEAKILFSLLLVGGLVVAIYLARDSIRVLGFAAFGAFAALAYTIPPFKFCYRGLGESLVAMSFGPGIMLGTYYVLTGSFSVAVLLVSIAVGIAIGGVLLINEFKDEATDRLAGKRNLAVRLLDFLRKLSPSK